MDIIEMTITALKKNEFISLLRGDGEYKIETSQYSPDAELTDAGKILSRGIYKVYEQRREIKKEFENSLFSMLDKSDFDVYMVCLYIMSQLFKEKNGLSPFELYKKNIIEKLCDEIIDLIFSESPEDFAPTNISTSLSSLKYGVNALPKAMAKSSRN